MKKFLLVFIPFLLLCACATRQETNGRVEAKNINLNPFDYTPAKPDAENSAYPLEAMTEKTAFDYFKDEKLRSGWNLGNTLDAYNGGIAGETIWGNPRVNQALLNGVKAAGFDIIRIPVTWMGHIGDAPDYRLGGDRLKRVAEVAEMARAAGLKVIINLHHDGSTSSESKEEGWLSIRKASRNESDYEQITFQFLRMWKQLAVYFRNYGDWLLFEPFNELHDGGWGWSEAFKSNPASQLNIVNQWNQSFTDIVRSTGGNNASRFLIVPAYCTQPQQTLANTFVLPTDSVPGRQVVSFHYYDPYEFGIASRRSSWGTQADRQRTDADFAPFKPKFIDNNIPVIVGECGAVLQLYPADQAKEDEAKQSRREYLPYVFAEAKKYGLVPLYWDNGSVTGNGEKFGLFNRNTGEPNSPESDYLIKAMINAVR